MRNLVEIIVPAIVFFSIGWIITTIVNRRALHKERMNLIEKSGNPDILKEEKVKNFLSETGTLKYGLVAIGISLGCLVGSFLDQADALANDEIGYFFAVFLFTGIALVINYFVSKKEAK